MAEKKALVIEVDGRILLEVDSVGQYNYATGYDAESVVEEMVVLGMECLGIAEETSPDSQILHGIHFSFKRVS